MEIINAIILGIIQGLTEFLPVSSSGHLEIAKQILGEDKVALGSDFDGAIIPDFIANCAGLPKLTELMRENGFEDELIKKICSENWLKFLRKNF